MFINKKPPRPHALHEPFLHDDHKRPVTRRELLSAGLMGTTGMVMAPAWLGGAAQARQRARADHPSRQRHPGAARSRASATSARAPA